jgi:plastocyanin
MSKSKIFSFAMFFFFAFTAITSAQVSNITLNQTPGAFDTDELVIAPGDYQFVIANQGVDHEVGFVLAPKGKTDPANHIKEAYVKAPVKNGSSSMTNVVSLTPGEYVYFCPLNPTKEYPLTVKSAVKNIQLEQTTGAFSTNSLELTPGMYQFTIVNKDVDHEVGFVLAPKGKTDPANHIKEAYVKAPVKNGSSSITNVVSLTPGEYVYFCPLNPTKEYNLTVN